MRKRIKKKNIIAFITLIIAMLLISGCTLKKSGNSEDNTGAHEDKPSILEDLDIPIISPKNRETVAKLTETGKLGIVNGVHLSAGPTYFNDTFAQIGFEIGSLNDGDFSYVTCHYQPDQDALLYLYQKPSMNTKAESIQEKGFYGYQINAVYAENKPPVSWGGLTWGATEEDVIRAYGRPTKIYYGDYYKCLAYKYIENVRMVFHVYYDAAPSPGLQAVEMDVY